MKIEEKDLDSLELWLLRGNFVSERPYSQRMLQARDAISQLRAEVKELKMQLQPSDDVNI
ncbi:MAG: hypothetical protein E4H07_04970 [Nitrosomonadales bacterium]|nr:MAG: hypothetical protein E4H07_04970 [Nitrosomonadales bacterium]